MNAPLVKYQFSSFSIANIELSDIWHGRLGHVNRKTIKWMMKILFKSLKLMIIQNVNCIQAKQPRKPYNVLKEKLNY